MLVFSIIPVTPSRADLPDTIERILPSIVGIGTVQKTRRPSAKLTGTGFVVGDGRHVITNAHVIPEEIDTVSGLLGTETERTWNGTGSSTANRTRVSDENGDREYDMSSTSTILNVVHAVPRPGTWPLSGTITRNVTVVVISSDDTRTRTRTVVIEFNGTQFATITINNEVFTFDLETRTVVRDEEG